MTPDKPTTTPEKVDTVIKTGLPKLKELLKKPKEMAKSVTPFKLKIPEGLAKDQEKFEDHVRKEIEKNIPDKDLKVILSIVLAKRFVRSITKESAGGEMEGAKTYDLNIEASGEKSILRIKDDQGNLNLGLELKESDLGNNETLRAAVTKLYSAERQGLQDRDPNESAPPENMGLVHIEGLKTAEEYLKAMTPFTLELTDESLKSTESLEAFLQIAIEAHISDKTIAKELSTKLAKEYVKDMTPAALKEFRKYKTLNIKMESNIDNNGDSWFSVERPGDQSKTSIPVGPMNAEKEGEGKSFDAIMSEAGIEMSRGAFRFNLGGVERSFKITSGFKASLQEIKTADGIKLACYEELLRIITGDNSITTGHANYNKHKVAGGNNTKFEASNTELKSEISRLKSEPAPADKPAPDEESAQGEEPAPAENPTRQARRAPEPKPRPTFEQTQKTKLEGITKTQEDVLLIASNILEELPGSQRLNLDTSKKPNKILLEGKDTGYLIDIRTEDHMDIANNGEFRVTFAVYKTGENPEYKTLGEWEESNQLENQFRKAFGIKTEPEREPEEEEKRPARQPEPQPPKEPTAAEKLRMEIERKNLEALKAQREKYSTDFRSKFDGLANESWEAYKSQGYDINRLKVCKPKVRRELDRVQHQVDTDFGKITEEKIREKFKETNGYKKVELILKTPPFNYHVEQSPKVFAEILSKGANDTVTLADVFEVTKEKLMESTNGKIPAEYFSSYIWFAEKLAEESLKKPQTEVYQAMIDLVLSPCQLLIEAAKEMDIEVKHEDIYRDWDKAKSPGQLIMVKEKERREYIEKLYEKQKDLVQGLFKLCGYDDKAPGDFSHIIALLHGGSKDHMTMADIDGRVFTVDEGAFKRFNSPVAVVYALTNQRELGKEKSLYRLENGEKILDEKAIIEHANRLIKLGYLNQFLAKQGNAETADKRKIDEVLNDPKFEQELQKLYINDVNGLKTLSKEQIDAFQAGYLVNESTKFHNQFEAVDSTGQKIVAKHPALHKAIQEFIKLGMKKEDIAKIQDMVMSYSTNAKFKEQQDGTWKLESATVGLPLVKLSDGTSVSFDITATKEGKALASLNLVFKIVDTNGVTLEFTSNIGVPGYSGGLNLTARGDYVDANLFLGASWSWGSIIPTIGGRFVLSWLNQGEVGRRVATKEERSNYKEAWAKWDTLPKDDIKARFELIKSIPSMWSTIEPLMKRFDLEEGDVVQMLENVKDKITEEVLADFGSLTLITGVGISMVGIVPMPVVQIKIGTAVVSIPNRKELSRVLPTLSSKVTSSKIDEALLNMAEKRFVATMPNLVYGRDGKLLTLVSSDEINLSALVGDLSESNKSLETAEVALERTADGRIKLNVFNTTDKDVEIHYAGIKVKNENGTLYLEGDLTNLIISRERFTMPFERDEYKASVRDVIVIRRKSDHQAGMDSEWIQNYGKQFEQKLMGQEKFKTMSGTGIVDLASDTGETIAPGGFSEKEITERKTALERRRKVTGSMEKSAYQAEAIRPELFSKLDTLYKDRKFKTEFRKVTDNPEEIIKLIQKSGVEMNEKESNFAVIHLLNLHFTDLAGKNKSLSQIKRGIDRRIKWIKPIFQKRFEASLTRLGESDPAQKAAALTDIFFKNMYDRLITALKTGKTPEGTTFYYDNESMVQEIPAGVDFYSGSRRWDEGKITRALDETIDYNTLEKPEGLAHKFGLLTDTMTEYKLNSTDPNNRMIARLLLEMASPLPEDPKEFLQSKLALKIANTTIGVLLMEPNDYELVTQIYENPAKLSETAHKAAFEKFKALVTEIRTKQLAEESFTKVIRDNITIEIKPSTKIVAGAYTKCGNSSFYVEELGEINVIKRGQVVGTYNATTDRIDATMGKITASIFGAVALETIEKPGQGKTHEKPPKEPGQGKTHEKPGLGNPEAGNPDGNIPGGASPSTIIRPTITPQRPTGDIPG